MDYLYWMSNKPDDNDIKDGYGRTIKFLGLFGGAQVVSMILNLLRNKLSSRLLGTMGLGLVGLYNRTVQMFSDCTNLSLSYSAVRKLSESYENGSSGEILHFVRVTRSIALLTGIVGMLLFMFLSPLVVDFVDEDIAYSRFHLLLLSPVILFMAVSGGEVAVLRGVRKLNALAVYSLWTACVALLVSVPFYYFWGFSGIMPSIFIISFMQMAGVLYHSLRLFEYKASPFSWRFLRDGIEMIKLGAGYIYATILTSSSVWVIYNYISEVGGDSELGLFSAGFLMMSMLPSMLFAALDSEYYPRLSGAFGDKKVRNAMVNEQIEVHLLIQSPLILGMVVVLPLLLPLLFTEDFLPAVRMTQLAVFGLLFHILTYPISFMPLSKGDTFAYVMQETIYNVVNVLLVLYGYKSWGLSGAGLAMCLARLVDLSVAYSISRFRYGFRLSDRSLQYVLLNALLAVIVALSLCMPEGLASWFVGGFAVVASAMISVYFLMRYGNVFNKILKRLKIKK